MKLNHIQTKFVTFGFQNKLHGHNSKDKQNKPRRVSTSRFSPKTVKRNSDSSFNSPDSLFQRVQAVRDPKASVLPVVREWVSQGRTVSQQEIASIVRTLRGFKRYQHALQISIWMSDSMYLKISSEDIAVRLDLIHRVHGLEYAENYFNSMSENLRTHAVRGSLLRSYVRENRVRESEALMREMGRSAGEEKEKGSSFGYNMLISLYAKTGDIEKIDELMREMETKGIPHDRYTLMNRMSACIAASDVDEMEKTLSRLKKQKDRNFYVRWKVYSLAATGYIKLGMNEKAVEMLRKLEAEVRKLRPESRRRAAFMFLITLYSSVGDRDELLRVWEKYKPSRDTDAPYACMIRSLTKLDDIESAERVFKEWESIRREGFYEFRVVNSIVAAYCKKGLFERAELTLEKVNGAPYTSTWSILANGYAKSGDFGKAVEALRKGLSVGRKMWMPSSITLCSCLEYLKDQRDVKGMEEMIGLVKSLDVLSADTCRRLSKACYATGESFSDVLRGSVGTSESDADGFRSDDETI